MHNHLLDYINRQSSSPLTSEEETLIIAAFKPKKLRRKQYFLQEGDVCTSIGFIVKGAMRKYSVDEKGVEHIVDLYIEKYWVDDRESATRLTPSVYNIDAWEDVELLIITRDELLPILEKIPALVKMFRFMDERNVIINQRRLASAISDTAEKRYAAFAHYHPQFIQRFPQHIIASHLGITKETLSRVRRQAMK